MPRLLAALISLSMFLSACGTLEIYFDTPSAGVPAVPPSSPTARPGLSLNSSSDEIREAMLRSATKWLSVWMDGVVTQYAPEVPEAPPQSTREQVWIDQSTSRFRVLSGPAEGNAQKFLSSDGMTILEMDLTSGRSQSRPLPEFVRVPQFVPTLEPGQGYPQPLWGQMSTPLSQLAFTSDFAQGSGTFRPVATEFVAGRETLVVEWINAGSDVPAWRLWLDVKTAVGLRMQTYGKDGADAIQSEIVVNEVIYDDIFADSLFRAPVSLPRFGDVRGAHSEAVGTGTPAAPGRDALGELYFFTLPRQAGEPVELVRLPGLCVVGAVQCPDLESVETPFPFAFSLTPLSWSPDGNLAAFAYPDNANGSPQKLWLFDPAAGTWAALFEYAYVDPPFWSPDAKWIAFRVQNGLGGEHVYVVQPDGSELKNLTDSDALPEDGRPYVMDGWITGHILVRSAKPGAEEPVYLVRAADGQVRPMFEAMQTKAVFAPSSDGAWLAYDDYDYDSRKHTLRVAEPDGANARELGTFTGGTLNPIVWSPDNARLAFVYFTEFTQDASPSAEIYVINRDGSGLKQVYRGVSVGAVIFSPDGKFLLISETTSPTGAHLFTVDLDSLEQRILQAPGLSLERDWFMPSWRK